ncbi:PEST proteolytic signal-containing nuclear protein-like isoform X2 [Grammomys surdaster]|uniref:PEST proteolytic signal-containing nuclear protein-like isoform X2 n=1 Tax=Grammomys surdaster TaxID=491861 RepID=UPI00109EF491|nr:PEST proteolytic signal-containing nuclear protein-like isoform X2 [Grammomys surdaster]
MADGKAGEEKPEKPQRAGAAGGPEEEAEKPGKTKTVSSSNGGESSSRSAEKQSAEDEAADLPTKPTKMSKFGFAIVAFNEDEVSEPEEMPPEAKMSMKNIGRDTPTSAGPNSFNKGKHGFSDNQKLWERNIKSHLGNVHDQDN